MKAYKATFTVNGGGPETVLVGANTLSGAAKKAEEAIDEEHLHQGKTKKELVQVELTQEVIL